MNWRKLLFPPHWLTALLVMLSAASLVFVFIKGWEARWFAYAIYVFAFYTLTVLCIACSKALPKLYRRVRGDLYHNKYTNRYLTDIEFKTHVGLYRSLTVDLLYIAVNGVYSLLYSTWWFALFALYYTILAVMHFLLLRYLARNKIGEDLRKEWKLARICACILLTVNLALSGAVLMMIYHHRGFDDYGIFIYVVAMYTFYTTSIAIKDIVKFRKLGSPVMSVSQIIKLAAALVSMLLLETAMFSQFGGEMSGADQRLMIMLTGGGVAAAVVGMAVYTIVRATKQLQSPILKAKE